MRYRTNSAGLLLVRPPGPIAVTVTTYFPADSPDKSVVRSTMMVRVESGTGLPRSEEATGGRVMSINTSNK